MDLEFALMDGHFAETMERHGECRKRKKIDV